MDRRDAVLRLQHRGHRPVEAGTLSQATLNGVVARLLTEMFTFGMFDNPQTGSLSATVTTAAHAQTALQMGEEGTVLLKNNGLLPLNPNPSTKETIAVIGTNGGAAVEIAGGGSGGVDASNAIWPLTGIQDAVGSNVTVTYTAGDDNGTTDIPLAVTAAKAATYAIVDVSLPEGEESDLTTLDLSSTDETMIADVAAANPNTIVVINSGGPVVMPWLGSVAGVFENWYGGQETGAALAALIFGTVDPSGKLPVTFPVSLSQVPAQTTAQWPGTSTGVDYTEGVDIGYRWYQSQNITPLFPFGFGLSYYAVQDKVWVSDPDGVPWEIYTVLADVRPGPASPVTGRAVHQRAAGTLTLPTRRGVRPPSSCC